MSVKKNRKNKLINSTRITVGSISATIGSLNILSDFIAVPFIIRFRFWYLYYNIEHKSTLVELFFLSLLLRFPLPSLLKYRFHCYICMLSVMIIVPVIVLSYYCRTENTHITRTHIRTLVRFPVLRCTRWRNDECNRARRRYRMRAHTDMLRFYIYLYIYLYIPISLPLGWWMLV